MPHGHREHCLVLASFVLSVKLWRFPGLTCLQSSTRRIAPLNRNGRLNLMPPCQCARPDLFPHFRWLNQVAGLKRFCRALVCNDLPQGRDELRAERELYRMLLLWVLFVYALLIRTVTGQNGEVSALEPNQELELQCLQRDEDGDVHTTSHPANSRSKKIQTNSGYTLHS